MALPASVPQEANSSLIRRFGNCPMVARLAEAAVIRGGLAGFGGADDEAAGAARRLRLGGGLHDLLFDQAKASR